MSLPERLEVVEALQPGGGWARVRVFEVSGESFRATLVGVRLTAGEIQCSNGTPQGRFFARDRGVTWRRPQRADMRTIMEQADRSPVVGALAALGLPTGFADFFE